MTSLEKFQKLLKDIFQFEESDLDFGIYRIFNYKRKQIQDFIDGVLPSKIEKAFKKYKAKGLKEIEDELDKKRQKLIENLGKDALTPTGNIKKEFEGAVIAKEYLELKNKKEEAEKTETIQNQVFIDLYNFFSRYYEKGDFIPQYRYSAKNYKYAIPYNGEEVKLYWANANQYYIKTGLLFRDYSFKADNSKVIFRIVEAREELGSNKATKSRFFILDDAKPVEEENNFLIIRFQYRELIEEEIKKIKQARKKEGKESEGSKIQPKQNEFNLINFDEILEKIENKNLKLLLQKPYQYKKDKEPKPYLLYHLNRFTAKNTRDYFIHKNLKKFLSEQLDYFIKAEVLDIETISEEKYLNKHITRAKVVKEIGEQIIDFLSQIENFQKKLWEKKKFVIDTHYVITLDKIKEYTGEEFLESVLDEILKNKKQLKEWKELGFGEVRAKKDLILKEDLMGKEYKKLPIDTKYFNQEFKEKLLEKLTEKYDLDEILNGLLIKSENYQALNLILSKYKGQVQTIYIDPPFNKEHNADYLYNVKYKDSTWVSLLENRLQIARDLLNEKGSIFVRCDYNGNMYVRLLMNEIFGEENFTNEIQINRSKIAREGESLNRFATATDSIFYYRASNKAIFNSIFKERGRESKWIAMHSPYQYKTNIERIILGKIWFPPKGRHWSFTQEKINRLEKEGRIRINKDKSYIDVYGNKMKGMPEYLESEMAPCDSNWTDIPGYSQTQGFPTENSEILLKRVIESTSNEGDLVLDFFLGSGTTTAVAHKLCRKWIGVEMGDHFYSIVLPRMKKVLAYDKSGISKEKDVKEKYNQNKAGGFFKYQVFEQYEDTLDNIELKENKRALDLFKDDYLLKYFLDFETRESPYFLNIEHLKNPFSYKLKINFSEVGEPKETVVDIPETFNYLLGLKLKKIKIRKNNKIKYLFILGEKEGKDYAVVWREHSDSWKEKDFAKDKEFVLKEIENWNPQYVFVNGQSVITPRNFEVRYIEPEFKKLMES